MSYLKEKIGGEITCCEKKNKLLIISFLLSDPMTQIFEISDHQKRSMAVRKVAEICTKIRGICLIWFIVIPVFSAVIFRLSRNVLERALCQV